MRYRKQSDFRTCIRKPRPSHWRPTLTFLQCNSFECGSVQVSQHKLVVRSATLGAVDNDDRSDLAGRERVGDVQPGDHVLRPCLRHHNFVIPGGDGNVPAGVWIGEAQLWTEPADSGPAASLALPSVCFASDWLRLPQSRQRAWRHCWAISACERLRQQRNNTWSR